MTSAGEACAAISNAAASPRLARAAISNMTSALHGTCSSGGWEGVGGGSDPQPYIASHPTKTTIPPLHAHTRTINFAKTVFVVFFNSGVDRSHDFVCPTYNILSSYISSLQRSYPQACCRSATPQCQSAKLMRPQLLRRIALGFIWVYKPAVSTAFCSGRVGPMQRCRPLFCM